MTGSVEELYVSPSSPLGGSLPSLSLLNMIQPKVNCLRLFMQEIACAFCLALLKAGNSIAAKMAMIAITTSNSIKVKAPARPGPRRDDWFPSASPPAKIIVLFRFFFILSFLFQPHFHCHFVFSTAINLSCLKCPDERHAA